MAAQTIWIGTRTGAFALRTDERRKQWKLAGPHFLGHVIHHIVPDPRNPKSVTPGHVSEPGVWYAGTSPIGLFRSEDAGEHWEPVAGFNDHSSLDDGVAPSGVRGQTSTRRGVLRHDGRRGLGERERGRIVALHRAQPSGNLFGDLLGAQRV